MSPSNPSSRRVTAAVPPASEAPTITIGGRFISPLPRRFETVTPRLLERGDDLGNQRTRQTEGAHELGRSKRRRRRGAQSSTPPESSRAGVRRQARRSRWRQARRSPCRACRRHGASDGVESWSARAASSKSEYATG